ncbi:hypothetical protein C8A03DRAFT_38284 [Achaetomium macrosporum]|uniref:Uncharacterized protein n=1 Tax=Achaetomium macrosporum TaxID=79813 RepID=A0AAN7C2R6_9PEZI|nr:hypothetical protein C8A03DRAFT_38284 [Achaetomium macrosporum]
MIRPSNANRTQGALILRPEMVQLIGYLSQEEKVKYEKRLANLWEMHDNAAPGSKQNEAKKKIADFGKVLCNKLLQRRQQSLGSRTQVPGGEGRNENGSAPNPVHSSPRLHKFPTEILNLICEYAYYEVSEPEPFPNGWWDLMQLVATLPPRLTTLHLEDGVIDLDDLWHIVSAAPQLKRLRFTYEEILDYDGIPYPLTELLSALSPLSDRLESLDVHWPFKYNWNSYYAGDDWDEFLDSFGCFSALKVLGVDNWVLSRLGEDILLDLVKALPRHQGLAVDVEKPIGDDLTNFAVAASKHEIPDSFRRLTLVTLDWRPGVQREPGEGRWDDFEPAVQESVLQLFRTGNVEVVLRKGEYDWVNFVEMEKTILST